MFEIFNSEQSKVGFGPTTKCYFSLIFLRVFGYLYRPSRQLQLVAGAYIIKKSFFGSFQVIFFFFFNKELLRKINEYSLRHVKRDIESTIYMVRTVEPR